MKKSQQIAELTFFCLQVERKLDNVMILAGRPQFSEYSLPSSPNLTKTSPALLNIIILETTPNANDAI